MTQEELNFDLPNWTQTRHGAAAWNWIHTGPGGHATNMFIRLALGCQKRGQKVGAKCVWERLRWHYEIAIDKGEIYKLNNNYTKYVAMFAEDRVKELQGYFKHREVKR